MSIKSLLLVDSEDSSNHWNKKKALQKIWSAFFGKRRIAAWGLFAFHHGSNVIFDGADGLDIEVFHQNFRYIGGEEGGEGWAKTNAFHAEEEQGEQNDDGFLLIPSNVEGDGEVVDVVESKNFLKF